MLLPLASNIDPFIYRVTGIRGKRQITLSAQSEQATPRDFTRIGDHIAAVFASLEGAESARTHLAEHIAAIRSAEAQAAAVLSSLATAG